MYHRQRGSYSFSDISRSPPPPDRPVRAEPSENFAPKTFVLLVKSLEKCSFSGKAGHPRVGEFLWNPRSPRARERGHPKCPQTGLKDAIEAGATGPG